MGPSYELVSGLKAKVDRRLGRCDKWTRRGDVIWVTRPVCDEIYLEQTADEFKFSDYGAKLKIQRVSALYLIIYIIAIEWDENKSTEMRPEFKLLGIS